MRRLRFYLDVSVRVQLVDDRPGEHHRRAITHGFLKRSASRHEILISPLVAEELARNWNPKAREAIPKFRKTRRPEVVTGPSRARAFARELSFSGSFSPAVFDDLTHVGYALIGDADALLTWDERTPARDKVRTAVGRLCRELGRRAPLIGTPEDVIRWLNLKR